MFSSYPYHHSPSYGYGNDFGYSAHPRSPQSYYAAAQAERQRRARLQAQAQAQRQALAERQYQARLQAQAEREAQYWAQRRAQPRAFMPEEYDSDPAELDGWGFRPAYHRKQTRSLSPSASLDSQDLHPALHRRQTRSASPPTSTSVPARQPSPPPKTVSREDQEAAASTIQHAYRAHRSLTSITAIERAFDAQKQQFTFPTIIDYQDGDNMVSVSIPALSQSTTPSTSPAKAKLAFTSHNKPLHAHMESLSRLLTSLDGVDSWGEKRIRLRRKEVVRKIEQELQDIEGVEDGDDRSQEELVKGWRGVWRLHSSQTQPEPGVQEEPVSSEEQVVLVSGQESADEKMEVGDEEQVAEPVNEKALVHGHLESAIDEEMEVGGEEQVAEPVNEEALVHGQDSPIDEEMEVGGEEQVAEPVNEEALVPGQDGAIDEEMEVEEDLVWHDAESFNLDDSEPEYVLVDSNTSGQ